MTTDTVHINSNGRFADAMVNTSEYSSVNQVQESVERRGFVFIFAFNVPKKWVWAAK